MKQYDAIVVGAGAAGGIVAALLCEAGKHVLLLERGRALSFEQIGRDPLRNQRISLYGHNAGPDIDGNPRVRVDAAGLAQVVRPHEPGYHNNAACVGGGTRVYGAQAWRFLPDDFRMASRYGVPPGSSLADWPITYDELAPFYARAEQEIGVAGDSAASGALWPRAAGFPMPPVPPTLTSQTLRRGAERLGWTTLTPPLAINTVPHADRPACSQCVWCVGFGCPVDAKNGTHNTMIPRALATGLCELVTGAQAGRIEVSGRGCVTGVSYFVEADGSIEQRTAEAAVVVVSGGAIESARLLLNSASALHPQGLGNEHGLVGRNLQGHYYPGAYGLMEEPVWDGVGPGVSIATCRFNHGNEGIIGGGMLANEFIKLPLIFRRQALPPDVPRWGLANKQWMRHAYPRALHVIGPVQEIPSPDARVTVDPSVRDRFGSPVARLLGTTDAETVRTAEFMRARAEEWLGASGAVRVWSSPPVLGLSAGQHQAGTCRMGGDPATSVCDPLGRVHGHDNLYVIDGSLHVTNGGFNPALTIMALAFRCGDSLARR